MSYFKFGQKYHTYKDDAIVAMAYAISEMVRITGIPKKYLGRNTDPINFKNNG